MKHKTVRRVLAVAASLFLLAGEAMPVMAEGADAGEGTVATEAEESDTPDEAEEAIAAEEAEEAAEETEEEADTEEEAAVTEASDDTAFETDIENKGSDAAEPDEDVSADGGDAVYEGFSYYEESGYVGISGYSGEAVDLVIPESIDGKAVRYISKKAFSGMSDLRSVTFPKYLLQVGDRAFENCTGLKSVIINSEKLSDYNNNYAYYAPFFNAGALDGITVTFGNGVTRVPAHLFETHEDEAQGVYCRVKKVVLSDSVTEIGDKAFKRCFMLSEAEGGASLTNIGEYAFTRTAFKELPAFPVLEDIGEGAFSEMPALSTAVLGDKLTFIGRSAFSGDPRLEKAVLGKNLVKMGNRAFMNCTGLKELTINCTDMADYNENYAYYAPFENAGSLEGFTIITGEGVNRLPAHLFETHSAETAGIYCKVSKLVLSDSVKEIGASSFCNCYALQDIEGGKAVTVIRESAFRCTKLNEIKGFSSLETIEKSGFSDIPALRSLELGDELTFIGPKAFAGDAKLERAVLGKKLKKIGDEAFGSCTGLRELTINCTDMTDYNNNYAYYAPFWNAGSVDGFTVTAGEGVKRIPAHLFETHKAETDGSYCRVSKLVLSADVKEIGACAFHNCFALKQVYSARAKSRITIGEKNDPLQKAEWIVNSDKPEPVTGEIRMEGEKVNSLKAAFKSMNDAGKDYMIELDSDVKGEVNLTVPKTAGSVTINGNGHTIEITGSKLTANCLLILEDVTITAKKKNGDASKLTVYGKKGLMIGEDTRFSAVSVAVKSGTFLRLFGELETDSVNCKNLILDPEGCLKVSANDRITIKGDVEGLGGVIELEEGFNRPVSIGGIVRGTVRLTGAKQPDGTQILKTSVRKLGADPLKNSFDVSDISDNGGDTYLYYLSSGKACIFGETITVGEGKYGLWKDAVAAVNTAVKNGNKNPVISIDGDVNIKGKFLLPKKGYESLTIEGSGTITFTGDIRLTGNTVIAEDITFNKVDKKGVKQSGKVNKGKFTYNRAETF
ncbi:MAG: leucine-rich repeat domain-containing protein [Lachnospiraceae bacterium]|nr:leucine-rich repeat domain-containing protein [Lachnospiraceae bacterium]